MIAKKIMGNVLSLSKQVANQVLKPMGFQMIRIKKHMEVSRLDLYPPELDGVDSNTRRVLNLLGYTTSSGSDYRASEYPAGYHSIAIGGKRYAGQRSPNERLRKVPFDFKGKKVLDIGCNQGGMLFEIVGDIEYGVGIDYDSRMINAANRVRSYHKVTNIDFYVFDLEKENLGYIEDFLSSRHVDIVFLLSICMWIKNWTEVIDWACRVSNSMLFESNGSSQQQKEQEDYLMQCFEDVNMLSGTSDDDLVHRARKLYLCSRSKSFQK